MCNAYGPHHIRSLTWGASHLNPQFKELLCISPICSMFVLRSVLTRQL
jgi:hypothetical protein